MFPEFSVLTVCMPLPRPRPFVLSGPGVSDDLRIGDAVFGLAHGCMGTRVVGPAEMLVPLPPSTTFEEGATVPTVS